MSIFDDSSTDGKPWLSAFHRLKNRWKWTSSKVMAISSWGLWFENFMKIIKIQEILQNQWKSMISLIFIIFMKFSKSETQTQNRYNFWWWCTFWWVWYRLKAERQGFPSVEESSKMDITIKSYGHFEFGLGFSKIHKNHKSLQNSLKNIKIHKNSSKLNSSKFIKIHQFITIYKNS